MPGGTYRLDDSHGYIYFSYSHLGFSKPTLRFRDFELTLELDKEEPANSSLEVVIDAASIDTGVAEASGLRAMREQALERVREGVIAFEELPRLFSQEMLAG